MKRFEFTLQTVLNVKEARKKQFEQAYGLALKDVKDQEIHIQKLRSQFNRVRSQAYKGGGINYFLQKELFGSRMRTELKLADQKYRQLKEALEEAQILLRESNREVLKMEKVRDHERSIWEQQILREEQYELDEIGIQRFIRQKEEVEQ